MSVGVVSSESVVFDYTAGTPWVVTDEIERTIERATADGRSVRTAVRDETTRLLRTDPDYRAALRERYAAAGVNLVSVTVNGAPPRDDVASFQARFDAVEWLRKVTSPAQARAVAADGDVGVVLNTQNLGAAMDGDLGGVDALHDAGHRIFQLTYNLHTDLGAGCYARSNARLSRLGAAAMDRVTERGGIVDLSHPGPETTRDAIERADAPPATTHVACGALVDHPRAKADETLSALAAADGYVGIVGVPWFVAPEADDPSLDIVVDHLEHAASVVGVDRIGIGTDFGHVDAGLPESYRDAARRWAVDAGFPDGYGEGYGRGFGEMRRYADWPVLRERIADRFTDAETRGILGENFLDYWARVEAAA